MWLVESLQHPLISMWKSRYCHWCHLDLQLEWSFSISTLLLCQDLRLDIQTEISSSLLIAAKCLQNLLWSLGPNPTRTATNRWHSRCLRTQARSLYWPKITQKEMNPMRVKGMNAYIRVREVRNQVPGNTCNGTRTNSAINNTGQELHKRARGSAVVPRHQTEAPW